MAAPLQAVVALATIVVLAAACGSGSGGSSGGPAAAKRVEAPAPGSTTAAKVRTVMGDEPVQASRRAVAQATGALIQIFDRPGAAAVRWTLDSPNPRGMPVAFLVEHEQRDWLHVDVPIRPNGSSGWVRKADVALSWTDHDLHLDLSDRTLTVHHRGQQILSLPVAVGAPATPTPVGAFYLTEMIELDDPADAYGPYVFGLSAFSEVLEQFNGADPIIGLHGTNHPELIGSAVSNGCIRMTNDNIGKLTKMLPVGTPIMITA